MFININRHAAPVIHAWVTVVMSCHLSQHSFIDRDYAFCISWEPVQRHETAAACHLVVAIYRHGVVDASRHEWVVPEWIGVVEICARILSNVHATPPQIEMQLVHVAEA